MKKIVIASLLSVAALSVSAQTVVYGSLRSFVDNTKTGAVSTTSMVSDSSRIGVTVTEQLGGGLSARATLETSIASTNPNGANTLGDRQSTVGIASSLGSVDVGRKFNSHFLAVTGNDAFGTAYGSVAGDVHNVRTVRSGDAVFVNSKLGPVAVAVDRTVSTAATEATTVSLGTTFNTALGAVSATVARFESGVEKSTVVAGQTKAFGTQVFLSHSVDNGVAGESKGTLVGAAYTIPASPLTVKTSIGRKTGDVTAWNLGAEYALSKRTGINVAYRNVNAATDVKQVGVGLVHQF